MLALVVVLLVLLLASTTGRFPGGVVPVELRNAPAPPQPVPGKPWLCVYTDKAFGSGHYAPCPK